MTVGSKQINEMHCNQLIEDDFDLFVQFRKISFVSILMIRKTCMVLQKKLNLVFQNFWTALTGPESVKESDSDFIYEPFYRSFRLSIFRSSDVRYRTNLVCSNWFQLEISDIWLIWLRACLKSEIVLRHFSFETK